MTALARFEGGSLGYAGQTVLEDLQLTLTEGERVALLGRSGAGKSTLLAAVRRQVEAGGARLALVPQDHGLVPQLSVHLNVWMGGLDDRGTAYNLANLVHPFARERRAVSPWLERVGLTGLERRKVETLSGGQRQRTALARALYRGGAVVLADEPLSAVDPEQGARLLKAISERFPTVLMALHDTEVALGWADRVIGLRAGRVTLDRPAAEVGQTELAALYAR